ncbi:MAG: hypothetical protein OXF88_01270 [Rhodobacteraceae bacterium]|nr:hypothetical protein [Paracoccaceae bacterium]MCY4137635.1 hypothetical protein [Paracoccaceae bacterium]
MPEATKNPGLNDMANVRGTSGVRRLSDDAVAPRGSRYLERPSGQTPVR